MPNILICDDEVDIVNALKIYLCDAEYKLFEAFNGQEALDVLQNQEIHLVLMDIMMPVMDGIQAMAEIRKKSNVPIIMITARSEDTDMILGLNVGADDYITKPFNPLEVTAKVKSQLRWYLKLGGGTETVSQDIITIGGIELNDMLNNETADRQTVFAGFANSQEFYNLCEKYGVVSGAFIVGVPNDQQGGVNCFVARLYKVCLNRLPDIGGQAGWVQKLLSGEVTGTTCAYGFVFSPEFTNLNLDNSDFVKYMYKAFFGREADEDGLNYWVEQLNNGTATREDIFAGFSGSAEFANLCAGYGINV